MLIIACLRKSAPTSSTPPIVTATWTTWSGSFTTVSAWSAARRRAPRLSGNGSKSSKPRREASDLIRLRRRSKSGWKLFGLGRSRCLMSLVIGVAGCRSRERGRRRARMVLYHQTRCRFRCHRRRRCRSMRGCLWSWTRLVCCNTNTNAIDNNSRYRNTQYNSSTRACCKGTSHPTSTSNRKSSCRPK